jgi:hypothetical protein
VSDKQRIRIEGAGVAHAQSAAQGGGIGMEGVMARATPITKVDTVSTAMIRNGIRFMVASSGVPSLARATRVIRVIDQAV